MSFSLFCFVSFFVVISRVLLFSNDCHLWWKLVKKIEEPTKAVKTPKGLLPSKRGAGVGVSFFFPNFFVSIFASFSCNVRHLSFIHGGN